MLPGDIHVNVHCIVAGNKTCRGGGFTAHFVAHRHILLRATIYAATVACFYRQTERHTNTQTDTQTEKQGRIYFIIVFLTLR